jgi:hypothetical protein
VNVIDEADLLQIELINKRIHQPRRVRITYLIL